MGGKQSRQTAATANGAASNMAAGKQAIKPAMKPVKQGTGPGISHRFFALADNNPNQKQYRIEIWQAPDSSHATLKKTSEAWKAGWPDKIEAIKTQTIEASKEHQDSINCLAFSFDNSQIISGSEDGVLCLWDIATGVLVKKQRYPNRILAIALDSDNTRLAIGFDDGSLNIYDIEQEKVTKNINICDHKASIISLAWSKDDEILLIGSSDNKLRHITLRDDRATLYQGSNAAMITSIATNAQDEIVLGDASGQIHKGNIDHLSFVNISGSHYWDTFRSKHRGRITSLSFKRTEGDYYDDTAFFSVCMDNVLALDPFSGSYNCHVRLTFEENQSKKNDRTILALSAEKPNTPVLAQKKKEKSSKIKKSNSSATATAAVSGSVSAVALPLPSSNPNKKVVTELTEFSPSSASKDRRSSLYFTIDAKTKFDLHDKSLQHGAAVIQNDLKKKAFSILVPKTSGKKVITTSHADQIVSAALSKEGDKLISAGQDYALCLREVKRGIFLRSFYNHRSIVSCIAFNPNGSQFVSGDSEGLLCFWDLHTGKLLKSAHQHKTAVTALSFNADGTILLSAGLDRNMVLWDIPNHKEEMIPECAGVAICMAFHANAKLGIAGNAEGSICLIDLTLKKVIETIQPLKPTEKASITSIAMHPSQDQIVFGTEEGMLYLLGGKGRERIKTYSGYKGRVVYLDFHEDTKVVSRDDKGSLCLWDTVKNTWNTIISATNSLSESTLIEDSCSSLTVNPPNKISTVDKNTGDTKDKNDKENSEKTTQEKAKTPDTKDIKSWILLQEQNDDHGFYDALSQRLIFTIKDSSLLAFIPQNNTFMAKKANIIHLQKYPEGQILKTYPGLYESIYCATANAMGNQFVMGSTRGVELLDLEHEDNTSKVVTAASMRSTASAISFEGPRMIFESQHKEPIIFVAFNPNDKAIYSADQSGLIVSWDKTKRVTPLHTWNLQEFIKRTDVQHKTHYSSPKTTLEKVLFNPDKNRFLILTRDDFSNTGIDENKCSSLWRLDIRDQRLAIQRIIGPKKYFVCFDWNIQRNQIITTDYNTELLFLWDATNGKLLKRFEVQLKVPSQNHTSVTQIVFNENGDYFVTCTGTKLQLWDIANNVCLTKIVFQQKIKSLSTSIISGLVANLSAVPPSSKPLTAAVTLNTSTAASVNAAMATAVSVAPPLSTAFGQSRTEFDKLNEEQRNANDGMVESQQGGGLLSQFKAHSSKPASHKVVSNTLTTPLLSGNNLKGQPNA